MKTINLGKLAVLGAALTVCGVASAQTVRHDFMDIRAAREDIIKQSEIRREAYYRHDWGKVAQCDRLIAQDRYWIRKDERKLSGGRYRYWNR